MKDIICVSGVELLMEYLEGTLAPDVRAAIDAHVAGCPRCVAFIDSYRKTPRILRDATASGDACRSRGVAARRASARNTMKAAP